MSFWCQTSSKKPTELFLYFCPEIFCTFLGASWKLFQLSGDLVSIIMNKEANRKPQKASRKPPGRYIKFQGRNPEIISLVFWKKFWHQKDILKLTDLYVWMTFICHITTTYISSKKVCLTNLYFFWSKLELNFWYYLCNKF